MASMLKNEIVTLEPADHQNVDLLVRWTLDPVAQGLYKRVPRMTAAELVTALCKLYKKQLIG